MCSDTHNYYITQLGNDKRNLSMGFQVLESLAPGFLLETLKRHLIQAQRQRSSNDDANVFECLIEFRVCLIELT